MIKTQLRAIKLLKKHCHTRNRLYSTKNQPTSSDPFKSLNDDYYATSYTAVNAVVNNPVFKNGANTTPLGLNGMVGFEQASHLTTIRDQ